MIDEKKLIEQLKGYKSEWKLAEPFHEGIASGLQIAIEATEKQPKVGEWIPCSERLPEENIPVITCDKNGWISVNINSPYVGKKNDFECGYYVAWMPLPEPYRGEEHGTDA